MPQKRVTIKTIAKAAGVSPMTVSYALRNSTQIKATTRQRIQKLAANLGYRPDPALSALVAYRTARSTHNFGGVLALMTFGPSPDNWHSDPYVLEVERSARLRADELGYQLQTFWADDPDHQNGRMDRILRNRGIQGVLLARQATYRSVIPLDLSRYAVIGLSRSLDWTGMDFVTSNHFTACSQTFAACVSRGYQRIGFVPNRNIETRFDHRMLGAFLGSQSEEISSQANKIPHHFLDREKPGELMRWFEKYNPDVVLTPHAMEVRAIIQKKGPRFPRDIGLANPVLLDDDPEISGIRQPVRQIGAEAVDMLHTKILLAQWGPSRSQKNVVLNGDWHEGKSLRTRL